MIKHIILWQLSDELTAEEKLKTALAAKKNLEGLKGKIEGLEDIEVITGKLNGSNADMMLDSTFTTEKALAYYSVNPLHVAVADTYVRPYIKSRSCMNFEVYNSIYFITKNDAP